MTPYSNVPTKNTHNTHTRSEIERQPASQPARDRVPVCTRTKCVCARVRIRVCACVSRVSNKRTVRRLNDADDDAEQSQCAAENLHNQHFDEELTFLRVGHGTSGPCDADTHTTEEVRETHCHAGRQHRIGRVHGLGVEHRL